MTTLGWWKWRRRICPLWRACEAPKPWRWRRWCCSWTPPDRIPRLGLQQWPVSRLGLGGAARLAWGTVENNASLWFWGKTDWWGVVGLKVNLRSARNTNTSCLSTFGFLKKPVPGICIPKTVQCSRILLHLFQNPSIFSCLLHIFHIFNGYEDFFCLHSSMWPLSFNVGIILENWIYIVISFLRSFNNSHPH